MNHRITPWGRFVASFTALVLIPLGTMPTLRAADIIWTAGSATDFLWSTSSNWSTLVPTSTDNAIFASPIPNPGPLTNPQIITLGAGSLANSLSFKDNYTLTGGDLTLTTGGIRADLGIFARIDALLAGTAGLTKTGGGSVRLSNSSNSYTGTTTISNGSVIINSMGALGTDTSAVVVTGSASRGFGGGSLVLEGGYGSGVTFTRGLSLQGLGPIADRSAALLSLGTNTVSGAITSGNSAINTRINSVGGVLTMSGGLDAGGTAATTVTSLGGVNSTGTGGFAITGALTGSGILEKTGSGTLLLNPSATAGFSGTVRAGSSATGTLSSIRITSPGVLGSRTATGTGSVLDLNTGTLEVLMDAPSLLAGGAAALVYQRASSSIFVDHSLGGTAINGTATFGALTFEDNFTLTLNGRNGYGVTFAAAPVNGGDNNSTITNNLSGLLTFTGAFWSNANNTANRTMTINGNGNTTISGNVTASAAAFDHNLTKQGTGTLQITSTGSTLDGNVNIQNGTVQITDFRSITNNTSTINFSTGAGNNVAPVTGTLTLGTATAATSAGLTTSKVLNLVGSTGGAVINANQSVASPAILNGNLTSTALGTATYTLGGTVSTQENIVNGVISNSTAAANTTQLTANAANAATTLTLGSVDGIVVGAAISGTSIPAGATVTAVNTTTRVVTISAAITAAINGGATITVAGVTNLTGVTKTGAALWALAGTNTYTGTTSVTNGTLRLKASAGASAIVADASPISLGLTGNVQNSGGTLELLGVNGVATTETLGTLSPTTGATTVKLTSGGGGAAANLVFSSLGTVAAGTGTNFNTSTGGGGTVAFTAAPTLTTGIISPMVYVNGADFASHAGGVVSAATYTTAAGSLAAGNTSPYLINSAITQTASATVSSGIKITGANTYTLGAGFTTTIQAGANGAGGILATGTGAGATITGGTGITTGGTGTLAVRVDGASDVLTIASVLTSGTTGGLTKNGAGTLVLSGVNAQTGATNINEGTVRLSGTGRLSGANVITNIRSGATLDLNGVSSGTAIGQINGGGTVTNSSATAATLQVGNNNGTGTFSGIIQNGAGVVNVTKVGTGAQTWSGLNTYTGVTTIGSSGLVSVPTLANIGTASGIGRGDNTSAATNAASLVFNGTTGGIAYTGTTSVSIDRLFTMSGGGQIANNSSNGSALIFNNTDPVVFGTAANQTLTLGGTSTGDSRIGLQLVNPTGFALSVNKINSGLWTLGNASNSYTGTTTITQGTLVAQSGSTLPTASGLILGATTTAGVFETTGTLERNVVASASAGSNTISWNTSLTTAGSGLSAGSSKLIVAFGGVATPTSLTWGTGGFAVSSTATAPLILNSATAQSELEWRNPIDLNGGSRTIQVVDNGNTATDFATITGVISNSAGTGNLNKTDAGTLQLFGANTYNGSTTITQGTLVVSSLGNSAVAGSSSVGTTTGANTLAQAVILSNSGNNAGLLQYVGAGETSDRFIQLGVGSGTGSSQIHADGVGPLILSNVNNTNNTAAKTLFLRGANTAGNTISSVLADNTGALSVTVDGGATWILSGANSHSGVTTVGAGALGIGNNSALGNSSLAAGNGNIFAHGADRTVSNTVNQANQGGPVFIGDYSLTFTGTWTNQSAANSNGIVNNIVTGKSLTLGNITNNSITADRSLTFSGTGDTNLSGNITNSTAFNLNPVYSGTGILTVSGTASDYWKSATAGSFTINSGKVVIGANEVIPNGSGSGANGLVVISPAAAVTATLDLNGKTETLNGITATSAGNVVIDNSSATNASLIIGDNNATTTIGGGGGNYTISNSGAGTLALSKIGTGTANITGSLTYAGSTTVTNGTLNLNSSIASPTLSVTSGGTLKLVGGVTTPANLTSVTVAGTAGAAFTGGTLSLASGAGTPFNNLATLNLGGGGGTTYLELDAGDSGTDTLTTINPATVVNTVHFLIKDIDLSDNTDYNLLVAPSGLTSGGAAYGFTLAGYTGGSLTTSDTLVKLTTGILITSDIYWNGGASSTAWNTIVTGTPDLTNFSSDLAGTTAVSSLPGKGQKILFVANTITGGAALNTTLEQSFKVNALEFHPSTVSDNTPASITIAPGAVASNSLTIAASNPANGLNLLTNGSPRVIISAPFVASTAQTWTTADSVTLTNGVTVAGTTVTVDSTTGLRPGMAITGNGIPAGTTIASVTNGTTFELSAAATAGTGQTFYAAQQLTMSGGVSGAGNITKAGTGKVLLTAASTGLTGTYFANAGITEATLATALSGVGASVNSGAPISIGSGGTFYYNNATADTGVGALNFPNPITLNGGTLSAGGNTRFYSGNINVSADSNINFRDSANATVTTAARNITFSGSITGSNAITLDSVNTASSGNQLTGTLTLSKASGTTWNGPLNFTRGTAVFTNVAGGGNLTSYVGFDGPINFNQFGRAIYRNIDGGTLTRTAAINFAASAVGEFQVDNLGALASNYTLTQSGAVNLNAGSIVRLTLQDAASNLEITGGVVLNGNASISVTGGDTDSLATISTTGISGAGNLAINDEAGAWAVSSSRLAINAASTFTGNTTLNEGTLILGHKDALSTGSFSNTGAASLQAGVDLSAGGSGPVANNVQLNNTLTIAGSNNLTLSGTFSATGGDSNRTLTNSLTAGTLVISGGVNLGATGNTAARNLTVNGIGNTEISGAIVDNTAFANTLVKSGTGTLTLSNSGNAYTGSTSLDQGTLAYTAVNTMTGAFNFGSANTIATTGTLDLSAASATFGSLVAQTDTTSANSLNIGSGQTLTITGNVTLGTARSAVTNTLLTATGGGSLVVQNTTTPPTSFVVGGATSAAAVGNKATVDLSGLSNLTVALNTTSGVFRVNPSNANNVNDRFSVLILPSTGVGTTTITTNSLNVGDGAQNNNSAGQINQLKLGTGVNTLNANTVNIGTGGRDIGSITFNSGTGSVVLRAADGISRAAFNMGTGGANTAVSGAQGNTFDVTGHNADLLLDAVTIGTQNRNSDLSNTFSFDTGTLDMTSLTMSTKGANGSTTTSTLNIGGGTVLSGAWTLATATGAGSAIATANLTGGTVTLSGNINRGTDAVGGGTATGTVNLDGSTLNMSGNNIGSATNQVVFNAKSGGLSNLNELNGGGTLTKTTAGVLTMSGTNSYTGLTDIQAGEVKAGSTTGLSGSSIYSVAASSILSLNGFSSNVGGLSGAGTVQNASATAANLILGANNGSPSVTGVVIQDGTGGGALSLIKQGTGTATISGTNTFSGKTTIESGSISVATVDAATTAQPLGTNAALDLGVAATSSGTLIYTGVAGTLGKNINALGNGTDTIQNSGTGLLTLSGTITKNGTTLISSGGSSGILITGSVVGGSPSSDLIITGGTTTLAGNNTYNGPTFLQPTGTLNVNSATAIGLGTLNLDGGTLDNTSGGAITVSTNNLIGVGADFTFTGTNDLNLGTGAVSLAANRVVTVSAGTLTIGGSIGGSFNLTGAGAGTLLLTGTSTYTGTTTVNSGATITAGGNGSLGDISSPTNVTSGGALVINNINYSDAEPLNLNGNGIGGTGALVGGNGTSSFAGPITIVTNSTIGSGGGTFNLTGGIDKTGTVVTFTGGGTFNIGGAITGNTGSPNSDLVVSGTTVNLNSANTYNGPTYVRNGGTLNANVASALPTSPARTDLVLDDSGTGSSTVTLAVNQAVASLAGAATSTVALGSNSLTIGKASGSTVYEGVITGSGDVTKELSSTITLAQASTYSGGTNVTGGTLNVTNTSGSATGSGTLTVGAGGTLAGTGTVAPAANNNIVVNGNVIVGNSTLGSPTASSLSLSTSGTGSILVGSTGKFYFDLFSGAGSGTLNALSANDYISLTGTLTPTVGSTLILASSQISYSIGDAWKLFDFATLGSNISSNAFTFDDTGLNLGVGQFGQFDHTTGVYSIVAVPEPSRMMLGLLGLFACLMRRRRKTA